ncbi:hypothetical protein OIU77_009883 [Salix suchowensis]|uniref:BHLH domain-containing protein n=1 Tax=Salix suchowensis TaxID=1278906 RepID=A0ABQ9A860_9ROSI|nr:hypothetical protein OIU77_009883 [Salix suchowensis]
MEFELLKSATEDQMELMMMMMMDKFPEFYGACSDVADNLSPTEFLAAAIITQFKTNSPRDFLSNPSSSRWRVPGELPDTANDYATPSQKKSSMEAMREMIYRIAAMQPIHIDPESVKAPKRRNVKISKDPQSVAARHRRERISERIRILQRLVPGGTKMDTASMLDEAIHYVKFLKTQVQSLERAEANRPTTATGIGFPVAMTSGSYLPMGKEYHQQPAHRRRHHHQSVQHYGDA